MTFSMFSISCGPGAFTCGDGSCVDESKVCNFNQDCHDGSDEAAVSVTIVGGINFVCVIFYLGLKFFMSF